MTIIAHDTGARVSSKPKIRVDNERIPQKRKPEGPATNTFGEKEFRKRGLGPLAGEIS